MIYHILMHTLLSSDRYNLTGYTYSDGTKLGTKNSLSRHDNFNPIRPSLFSRSPGPGGLRGPDAKNQS